MQMQGIWFTIQRLNMKMDSMAALPLGSQNRSIPCSGSMFTPLCACRWDTVPAIYRSSFLKMRHKHKTVVFQAYLTSAKRKFIV